jgi:hypothetical protein
MHKNITNDEKNITNDEKNITNNENNKSIVPHIELLKLKKNIDNLDKQQHIEIGKILKKNNIKLNENNNGIFINLNIISKEVYNEIIEYINFIKSQDLYVNIVEKEKLNLENIYFKNNKDNTTINNVDNNSNVVYS